MKTKLIKCQCDLCRIWTPLHRRIMAKLKGKDRKLYEQFVDKEENENLGRGVAEAKLRGDWPGWEWMKKAVKEHRNEIENETNHRTTVETC